MPRILTYNVHRCVGTDRKLDVARIADVIATYEPDGEVKPGSFGPTEPLSEMEVDRQDRIARGVW